MPGGNRFIDANRRIAQQVQVDRLDGRHEAPRLHIIARSVDRVDRHQTIFAKIGNGKRPALDIAAHDLPAPLHGHQGAPIMPSTLVGGSHMRMSTFDTEDDPQSTFGLDVDTGEYVDLFKAGIIDPAKVVRTALQNAASVAVALEVGARLAARRRHRPGARR